MDSKEQTMIKEFVITYYEWSKTRKETFFVHARDAEQAKRLAYCACGDLIDILAVEEWPDD
jgi:hypothetical protein